jgi:hypothetical protein
VEQQQSTRVRLVEDQQAANSDITEQELMRRKDFLEFGDDDVANLTQRSMISPANTLRL